MNVSLLNFEQKFQTIKVTIQLFKIVHYGYIFQKKG